VVDAHPERVRVVALAAGRNAALLAEQVARYRPRVAALADGGGREALVRAGADPHETRLCGGPEGLIEVATHPDAEIVLCASSGTAALEAVLAAVAAGKTIALANKEVLVMAGAVVTEAASRHGVALLPVDSEHNAIHQCLHGRSRDEITRLVLTASGGPFREWPARDLVHATLMNKGLEVIEAHWLFGVEPQQIRVAVHPQSIVHSMVELRDGSVIAQLGITDMRLPIQYAFSYPERWEAALPRLDLARCGPLEFSEPDRDRFPCLDLAYAALEGGGTLPVVLNAANEVAVEAFLDHRLPFTAIARVIERTLEAHERGAAGTLAAVREADHWARTHARAIVGGLELRV
jgi:1-deoxy-D-xylulose-5-phosphate reductoisomerase